MYVTENSLRKLLMRENEGEIWEKLEGGKGEKGQSDDVIIF